MLHVSHNRHWLCSILGMSWALLHHGHVMELLFWPH